MDTANVATLNKNRKHAGCALIVDSSTVLIGILMLNVVATSNAYIYLVGGENNMVQKAELWNTLTNAITEIDHPPGLESLEIFRPTIIPYDSTSVIMMAANLRPGTARLADIWKYDMTNGWTKIGPVPPEMSDIYQNGVISLEDSSISGYSSLTTCPKKRSMSEKIITLIYVQLFYCDQDS